MQAELLCAHGQSVIGNSVSVAHCSNVVAESVTWKHMHRLRPNRRGYNVRMPWMIQREDDEYCVYKKDEGGDPEGETLGCHPSEEDAQKQIDALHSNVDEASSLVTSVGLGAPITLGLTRHVVVAAAEPDEDGMVRWNCDAIMFLNTPTSDNRVMHNVAGFRAFPLPLMAQTVTAQGHDGAELVGRVDTAEVIDNRVAASGVIDSTTEAGAQTIRQIETGQLTGVSVDIGSCRIEADAESDLPWPMGGQLNMFDVEIIGLTACPFPAFADTRGLEIVTVVTAAAPLEPPVDWFLDPELTGRTRLTVTPEGRVFGHLAPWGECHIGIQGQCVRAPKSATNYGWFALGTMRCAEGCEIPIGTITMDTGHADKCLKARAAAAHYDDTGTAVADIAVGEDAYGIWVAGAMRPDATPEQYRALRAARLSGDWRMVNGALELVAALAVNVGGFPVWEEGVAADGSVQTVIASLEEAPDLSEITQLAGTMHASEFAYLTARVHIQ